MLYRNNLRLFSRLLGLGLAAPFYALLYPISYSLMKISLFESVHSKNRSNKFQSMANAAQIYSPIYEFGATIGEILDLVLCAALQPIFWASNALVGLNRTKMFIEKVQHVCSIADLLLKKSLKFSVSLMSAIPVLTLILAPLMLVSLVTNASFLSILSPTSPGILTSLAYGLGSVLIYYSQGTIIDSIKAESRLVPSKSSTKKVKRYAESEGLVLNELHNLLFPGDYSKLKFEQVLLNLPKEAEKLNGYISDHQIVIASKPSSKSTDTKKDKKKDTFYNMGHSLGKGLMDSMDKNQKQFIKAGQIKQGNTAPKAQESKRSNYVGGSYTLHSFEQTRKQSKPLSKKEIAQKRIDYFNKKFPKGA